MIFGTPNTPSTIKILMLGSGELGREVLSLLLPSLLHLSQLPLLLLLLNQLPPSQWLL